MNKTKLQELLIDTKVPKDSYCLNGGLPNEAYCLNKEDDLWEVYYSERGEKSQLKKFVSEEEACDYLFSKIIKNV
ncbi:hypothetical protein ABE41_002845 [Fictibacillus arsenicus]|jgi:hypothetical protein|uniref:Uncharacterized protein n=1 Tax=Fictibacillus arsenicus TaxID=255247 RepID=A0A1B1Z0M3_9BACL|nr:hypothetical protein [Fictibacillus arsenicus]ANX10950.1 hypothetical protein ABE41_002845 [Fictibacillus arsenicus]